jgi:ribosomal protein S11
LHVDNKLHDEASEVAAEHVQVMVDGPDGVAVSLTPDAAAETSDRLLNAALEAQGQILAETRIAKDRVRKAD